MNLAQCAKFIHNTSTVRSLLRVWFGEIYLPDFIAHGNIAAAVHRHTGTVSFDHEVEERKEA
jgi:hypothetical protein